MIDVARTADQEAAMLAAATTSSRVETLAEYERDKRAASAQGSADSSLATWIDFHEARDEERGGAGKDRFPLTRMSLARVAAFFKTGRYRYWEVPFTRAGRTRASWRR